MNDQFVTCTGWVICVSPSIFLGILSAYRRTGGLAYRFQANCAERTSNPFARWHAVQHTQKGKKRRWKSPILQRPLNILLEEYPLCIIWQTIMNDLFLNMSFQSVSSCFHTSQWKEGKKKQKKNNIPFTASKFVNAFLFNTVLVIFSMIPSFF